jgi:hypothetical protein
METPARSPPLNRTLASKQISVSSTDTSLCLSGTLPWLSLSRDAVLRVATAQKLAAKHLAFVYSVDQTRVLSPVHESG